MELITSVKVWGINLRSTQIKFFFTIVLILFLKTNFILSQTYYVNNRTDSEGQGTRQNPFSITQAINAASPGDTFYLEKGIYDISSIARLTFSKSGTINQPIVWIGEIGSDISVDSLTSSGVQSTVIVNNTFSFNEPLRITGQYNIFRKIIFIQNYGGTTFLSIGGRGTVLDSIAFKYPPNTGSSTNHSIYVNGASDVIFKNSTFRNGSRCIIWVQSFNDRTSNRFVLDKCVLKGASNHPAIQFMPMTNASNPMYLDSFAVKNCTFIDNPYGHNIYVRWSRYFAIYNNLFIRSGKIFDGDHHSIATNNGFYDTVDSKGSIIAFNTIVDNSYSKGLETKSFQNLKVYNNIFYNSNSFEYILSFNVGYRSPSITPINQRMKINYNLYYEGDGNYNWRFDQINGNSRTTNSYTTFNSYDGNNFNQNSYYDVAPDFMSPGSDDYRLNTNRTGISISTANGFLYDITTDKNGNPRNPFSPTIGCFEFSDYNQIIDNDPPDVLSAQIIDSVSVNVIFSEPLDPSTALNPNNYLIDNGIIVNNVQFVTQSVLVLNTSTHTPGFYSLTVNNITDTTGNVISPQNNSATYGYNPDPINQLLKFVPGRTNASSIPEPEHRPEKTFDGLGYNSGDPTSRWAGQYLPQWIGYDLNDVRMLSKVRIQFYNWQNGRIYNYSIQVSTDSVNWVSVKSNVLSQLAEWTEETFEPTPARYIRIIVHSNNQNDWATIWEVEFYGQLMVSNNDDQKNIPTVFALNQNYPNPFNPSTTISWQSPVSGRHTIKLFDMLGREIETIVDDYFEAGKHSTLYIVNSALPSGVYFYQLRIGDPSTSSGSLSGSGFTTSSGGGQGFVETKKMILLK
ncbi:MAG: discoidin domain-containing protein [Ignavibacterium sp.]|nr:discoidin domain-containing protein [Ignavibacterium sp.]